MTRYLVTGAGGYIGYALVHDLERRGYEVVTMRPPDGDVSKVEHWQARLSEVDIVFHLAARETVNAVPDDVRLDWEVNAGSILRLARACELTGTRPRIVFASSTNLVGCPAHNPITEDTQDAPLTIYAVHKRTAEDYLRLTGLPSVTLRLPNVYGCIGNHRLEQRSTINRMISRALAGLPLTTFANEDCVRDFMHIEDVVAGLLAAASLDPRAAEKFVLGTGEATRLGQAVHSIAAAVAVHGATISIDRDVTKELAAVEMRSIVVDASAFRAKTKWAPTTTFAAGIRRTVDEMRKGAA